jgi:hypothetical protein
MGGEKDEVKFVYQIIWMDSDQDNKQSSSTPQQATYSLM